ncbi:uncharacterized protein LOC117113785 isoform X1 [Anneissia japonica]|uniref:uncharacterized protein LOC117113785 isoform X1 n=1 Tax=Anneissia japonica TaxID=1529436 RepID=UPI00142562ED|nr:uncharacterized protein LOC117113785 isoform X1 [Anneissia japonica]
MWLGRLFWQVWPNYTGRYPSTWDRPMYEAPSSHRLVEVSKYQHQDEYEKIQKLFSKTLPEGNITKLERVQNYKCWDTYARQKEVMINNNGFNKELQLFHGTTEESVDDICRENFDFRLSGTRIGVAYGQGAYFARKASYSDRYAEADADNIKQMFVARVLVGRYILGTEDMRRPPYVDQSDKTKGMYDSCVDNASKPNIFVIFDNQQIYPEYLITYSIQQFYGSGAYQTVYSNTNQQWSNPNSAQSPHNSGNHQASNQFNTLPFRKFLRSVVGAYQTVYSNTNQQWSNPNSTQSPHSSVNQFQNFWTSIKSIKNTLKPIYNKYNNISTHLQIFTLLFIISLSVLLFYTSSSTVVAYLLFCLLTSTVIYIKEINVRSLPRSMIILILSFFLLLSLVLQLFTYGLQIILSFSFNYFSMYILISMFISAMIYANEMKIDVKFAYKRLLLSELLIVLFLSVIQSFLHLLILLTSYCYNNFGILYLMISMVIFTILYTNQNMAGEYKYKCGLISELVMLLMLPALPLFLYVLHILLLCCNNKNVICIGLMVLMIILAAFYQDKMKIMDGHVFTWVLISELIIILLLPVLQLILYLLQILLFFFVFIFLLVSILIPTMILNLVCM